MKLQKKYKVKLISPLLLAGILLILLPIFSFITLDRLEKQKNFFNQRLKEKGIFLVRTFEAGTRTGMFNMRWGAQKIQEMLYETALQPEVQYMMITDEKGEILAHSDLSQVGSVRENMPETDLLDRTPEDISHRILTPRENSRVFEVYKRFTPMQRRFQGRHSLMMNGPREDRHRFSNAADADAADMKNTREMHHMPGMNWNVSQDARHYIFAGLSMKSEETASAMLLKRTIWSGVLFFLIGGTGMAALFMLQEYRSARASLNKVTAFSNNVIENMPSGLVVLDSDFKITTLNRSASDILGTDTRQLVPMLADLIKEQKSSGAVINRELVFKAGSGAVLDIDVTISPVHDDDNNFSGYLVLFKDLTQIRELKKQVEINKRLAVIGKLAGGVAHEIRNPLSSIKGFASYFGHRYKDNPADADTAQVMVREVERINRSITQLLEFARPLDIQKQSVDINELLNHSLKLIEKDLSAQNIRVKKEVSLENPVIFSDPDRLNQVLLNLYLNALKAMEKGGELEIRVTSDGKNSGLRIEVRDSGSGIDPEHLDLIFDPYFTTRSDGTGLGLAIVHKIIESLGGMIQAASEKGSGTCFTITLPVI